MSWIMRPRRKGEDDDVEDDHVEAQDGTHTLARACADKMHLDMSQEPFYSEISRTNSAAQNRGPHFVRACAVEMHINVSQEQFYTEINRKNAAAQLQHPDQVPAFTITIRTPQCGHIVLGNNYKWAMVNCYVKLQGGI